jgi:hypothetical protein
LTKLLKKTEQRWKRRPYLEAVTLQGPRDRSSGGAANDERLDRVDRRRLGPRDRNRGRVDEQTADSAVEIEAADTEWSSAWKMTSSDRNKPRIACFATPRRSQIANPSRRLLHGLRNSGGTRIRDGGGLRTGNKRRRKNVSR